MGGQKSVWTFLTKNQWIFLIGWLLCILGTLPGLFQMEVSSDYRDFISTSSTEYQLFEVYQGHFGQDNQYFFCIGLESPESVFDSAFLASSKELLDKIHQLEGIDTLIAATHLEVPRRKSLGIGFRAFLDFQSEKRLEASQKRILRDSLWQGTLLSKKMDYLLAYAFLSKSHYHSAGKNELTFQIQQLLDGSNIPYVLTGLPVLQSAFANKIMAELPMFLLLFGLFVSLIFWILYRRIWVIIYALSVILSGILILMGGLSLLGIPINLLTSLFIPLLFIIGTSDIIYLLNTFIAQANRDIAFDHRVQATFEKIIFPISLTTMTTMIGFLTLISSPITPFREFGLGAALGIFLVYLFSLIAFAALRRWPKLFESLSKHAIHEQWKIGQTLVNWHQSQKLKPAVVFLICIGFSLLSIWGIFQIPTNNYLMEEMGTDAQAMLDRDFLEREAHGFVPLELFWEISHDSLQIHDLAVLDQINQTENWLQTQTNCSDFLSPAQMYQYGNYVYHFNQSRHYKLPREQVKQEIDIHLAETEAQSFLPLMTPDGQAGRSIAVMKDFGTDSTRNIFTAFEQYIHHNLDTQLVKVQLTGETLLNLEGNFNIRLTILRGLSIGIVVIGLLFFFLFRSWPILLISCLVNLLPLLWAGGLMGLFQINLTESSAIAFLIAYGIAIDDSIHFLSRFLQHRRAGQLDNLRNAHITLQEIGKSISFTSIILFLGFLVLCFSDFGGIQKVGFLAAMTIAFAWATNTLLLPILARWI